MSFPPFPSYRDSGVAWLRVLPSHWRGVRLKNLVEIKRRIAGDEGPDILSITQAGIRIRDVSANEGQIAESYAHYQLVEAGDFAMNAMDLLTGWVDIAGQAGVTSPDYRVFSLRHGAEIVPRYLLRVLQNAYSRRTFYALGQGASHLGRWRLPTDAFHDFVVPHPPVREQAVIAEFLDRETANIDALVEAQRRLIELLKEKRQAVISHAVTKGLDPIAPMKPSGIEWLGEVPAHWTVCSLGFRYRVDLGKMLDEKRISGGHLAPYLRNIDVQWGRINVDGLPQMDFEESERERFSLRCGDILVCEGGEIGRAAMWWGELAVCFYQKALHRLRPVHADASPLYLIYQLRAAVDQGAFEASAGKSTIAHLPAEAFRKHRFAFPPECEQAEIAKFLDLQTGRIDMLIADSFKAITHLQERRAALITAAVTGEIDVRGFAATDVRNAVAAEIIWLNARKPTFGRVKNQKLLFLAEAHAGIHEIGGQYEREAAGPLDRVLVEAVEADLQAAGLVRISQAGGHGTPVTYEVAPAQGRDRERLAALLGDRLSALDALNEKLGDLETRSVEAVATLYAVWNDALLDGESPNDDRVIRGVLEEWHPEKRDKFKPADLRHWLDWMRRNGIVPRGREPHTISGRLFP